MSEITDDMLDDKVRGKLRINLHIHARLDDGKTVFHVQHVGFFPLPIGYEVARNCLNAIGLAYHSGIARQVGLVDVQVCMMEAGAVEENVHHRLPYNPPRRRASRPPLPDDTLRTLCAHADERSEHLYALSLAARDRAAHDAARSYETKAEDAAQAVFAAREWLALTAD